MKETVIVKIILLSGKPSTGKSTALNLLYDKLIESGKCCILSKKTPSDEFDFECVVKYNNKTIAIVTFGDVLHWATEAIVKYANLDVLVLAYSNKFATELNKVVRQYDYHCVIKKLRASNNDNERVCNEILAQLEP
jgi:tRNA uridine 5-carbamoylmethylation protein Kti12